MFAFIYISIILASTFAGIYGLVLFQQKDDSSLLWVIPLGIILSLSVFITSKLGQKKGRDQMLHLVSFVYHTLDNISDVERLNRR